MEAWADQVKNAVAAGEREFGRLDAHQTLRHNLESRCKELMGHPRQPASLEEHGGLLAEGDVQG